MGISFRVCNCSRVVMKMKVLFLLLVEVTLVMVDWVLVVLGDIINVVLMISCWR